MKRSIFMAVFFAAFSWVSSVNAGDFSYKIEVCSIPLTEIVQAQFKAILAHSKLKHLFIRGTAKGDVKGLNFEPENKADWLGGKAIIGAQDYPEATCTVLVETNDQGEYDDKWKEFVEEYDNAAEKLKYSVKKNNCQKVTKDIMDQLGYEMPQAVSNELNEQCCIL